MSVNSSQDPPDEPGADVSHKTLRGLEKLDSYAHVAVAVFFLVLSCSVLIASAISFSQDLPGVLHPNSEAGSSFIHSSLETLSNLLFAVIILELLRTIITYLKTQNTQGIMREFLIVGIISSVRKILMTGAESSIIAKEAKNEHYETLWASPFVQESVGVVFSVMAILLLIGALILLKKYYSDSPETGSDNET